VDVPLCACSSAGDRCAFEGGPHALGVILVGWNVERDATRLQTPVGSRPHVDVYD
jgi:hypothetical protein